jgi:hypothetical protein
MAESSLPAMMGAYCSKPEGFITDRELEVYLKTKSSKLAKYLLKLIDKDIYFYKKGKDDMNDMMNFLNGGFAKLLPA